MGMRKIKVKHRQTEWEGDGYVMEAVDTAALMMLGVVATTPHRKVELRGDKLCLVIADSFVQNVRVGDVVVQWSHMMGAILYSKSEFELWIEEVKKKSVRLVKEKYKHKPSGLVYETYRYRGIYMEADDLRAAGLTVTGHGDGEVRVASNKYGSYSPILQEGDRLLFLPYNDLYPLYYSKKDIEEVFEKVEEVAAEEPKVYEKKPGEIQEYVARERVFAVPVLEDVDATLEELNKHVRGAFVDAYDGYLKVSTPTGIVRAIQDNYILIDKENRVATGTLSYEGFHSKYDFASNYRRA